MPQRITKTRLMRQRSVATPPPICTSKGKTAFFLRTCTCPNPGPCTSVDIQGLTFPEAMAMLPGPPGTYGVWRYIDKEHRIDEQGAWDECTPPGLGTGTSTTLFCDGTFRGFGTFPNITWAQWQHNISTFPAHAKSDDAHWISNTTGVRYDTPWSHCP